MERNIETIREDLEKLPSSYFVTKWMLDTIPYIFESEPFDYITWRTELSGKMNVDPTDILISGSANLGFSLNPAKNFKTFNESSDVDVCIVSPYYFDTAWREMLRIDLHSISPQMGNAVKDHRMRLIYWGTIATDRILPLLSFGPTWDRIINESRRFDVLKDREINFRIYKDRKAVRDYLIQSVEKSKELIWGGEQSNGGLS